MKKSTDVLFHWPEYISEFFGTAIMVGFGLFAIAFFWSSSSPAPEYIPNESLRRLVTGFFFAGGATSVVYSPLGQRSGGHINPSVTIGFLFLKKILPLDALCYIIAQFLGALMGASIVYALLVINVSWNDAVIVGTTKPGLGLSITIAFALEIFITWLLMLTILFVSNNRRLMKFTGICAGTLVMLEVWIEAPFTGTSLNAARSLGPALFAGRLEHYWIYATAPIAGALLGALTYSRFLPSEKMICSKLYHTFNYKCHMPSCKFIENSGKEE